MNTDMVEYYRVRANEYETLYYKPERQKVLLEASDILRDLFRDVELLEIACGTGYWTEKIAQTARSITATDINEAMLNIARAKIYAPAMVNFECCDMYGLNDKAYDGLFGGFIWSHIKLEELPVFITTMNGHVKDGGTIVFMDNIYVEGSNLPITRCDQAGNTYQTRTLTNGAKYEILKNFPGKTFLMDVLHDKAELVTYYDLEYYWILKYKTLTR